MNKLTTYIKLNLNMDLSIHILIERALFTYLNIVSFLTDPPHVGQTGQSLFFVKPCFDSEH